jgi:carbamoyltransferase
MRLLTQPISVYLKFSGDVMLIVAVAANEHDTSVSIATESEVLAVVEAERITRIKRQWCNADSLSRIIDYSLAAVKRSPEQVTHWCGTAMGNTLIPPSGRLCDWTRTFRLRILGRQVPFIAVNHHLAHAASGYFTSTLRRAIVDACDAGGDGRQHVVYRAQHTSSGPILEELPSQSPSSFSGVFFDICSYYLFKRYLQEGRLMGLAGHGRLVEEDVEWLYSHASELSTQPHEVSYDRLHNRFKIEVFDSDDHTCRSFARSVQSAFERLRCDHISQVASAGQNLVLSGGVALNIHANTLIRRMLQPGEVFVPPCCDDSGQSLGALLYVANVILGANVRASLPFLGLGTTPQEEKLSDKIAYQLVDDLMAGRVVAWHWGRAEIGPRALGHRSLLCSPVREDMRVLVSEKVKGRENYRPVAPIVLAGQRQSWFSDDWDSPYMLFSCDASALAVERAPAAVHVDGTARIQTIGSDHVLAPVLQLFEEASGVPMLINTSLNGPSQPMTQTADDTRAFCRDRPGVIPYINGQRITQ